MKYYIISGEASGDIHGSELILELKKLWEKILQESSLEFSWRNKKYKFITKAEKEKNATYKIIRNLFIKLNVKDQVKLLSEILDGKKTTQAVTKMILRYNQSV